MTLLAYLSASVYAPWCIQGLTVSVMEEKKVVCGMYSRLWREHREIKTDV